jgi:hypothetical protein
VETVAHDCATLQGIDGLRRDPRSPKTSFLAANNFRNTIVGISRSGDISVIASGSPELRTPVDLAHVSDTKKPSQVLILNPDFASLFAGEPPRPALTLLTLP